MKSTLKNGHKNGSRNGVAKAPTAKKKKVNGSALAPTLADRVTKSREIKPKDIRLSAPKVPTKVFGTTPKTIVTKAVVVKVGIMREEIFEDFKVGDKVVYPAHGVGSIDSIQSRKISNSDQKFYMLTILETGMKIMVPTSQVRTVGLRKVVDSKTVDKVYDILRDRNVILDSQTWNRRYREYTQKIKTGSVFEIAKVIRDLSVLKTDKELSFGERKMLDTAQGLLVKEISIAKSRPEDSIRAELQELFQPA